MTESVLTVISGDQAAWRQLRKHVGEVDGAHRRDAVRRPALMIHFRVRLPSLYTRQRASGSLPTARRSLHEKSFAPRQTSPVDSQLGAGDYRPEHPAPEGVPRPPDAHFAGWLRYLGTVSVNQALSK